MKVEAHSILQSRPAGPVTWAQQSRQNEDSRREPHGEQNSVPLSLRRFSAILSLLCRLCRPLTLGSVFPPSRSPCPNTLVAVARPNLSPARFYKLQITWSRPLSPLLWLWFNQFSYSWRRLARRPDGSQDWEAASKVPLRLLKTLFWCEQKHTLISRSFSCKM